MLQVPWYKKNLAAFKRVRSLLPELQEPQAKKETQSPKLPPPTGAANTEELELDDLEAIGAAPAQQPAELVTDGEMEAILAGDASLELRDRQKALAREWLSAVDRDEVSVFHR